jgi:Fic family protein
MKMPKRPPGDQDLFDLTQHDSQTFAKLFSMSGPCVEGKYLHWDKLRYYTPPEGLSLEQWWFGLKLKRRSLYKAIPLSDKEATHFSYLDVEPMGERLHQIDQGCGGMIQMPESITNPDTRNQYYVSSLVEEAITSSQLEGAVTTRKVAKEMLANRRPPADRSEQMILNNFRTMQQIRKIKNQPLSRDLIMQIHHQVADKALDDSTAAGRMRTSDERIVVADLYDAVHHDPPLASELEDRMQAMCDFANGKSPGYFVHPVVRAIILHFWLAYDHPFVDGNGRTARALFYWSMLNQGYWLFEFVSISQLKRKAPAMYARAFLYTETDDNDLTYFILYHLEVLRKAIDQLHQYIGKKTKQIQQAEQHMQGILSLNHRQRALITHALRHATQKYTIRAHQVSHNIVYQTARTDLLNLEERGLMTSGKSGRTIYYLPAKELEKMLASLDKVVPNVDKKTGSFDQSFIFVQDESISAPGTTFGLDVSTPEKK